MIAWSLVINAVATLLLLWIIATPLRRRFGYLSYAERRWRDIHNILRKRAEDEIRLIDQVLLVVEDLIRVEPERAESLEIARLELLKIRADLGDERALAVLVETPVKSAVQIARIYRDRQRRHRTRQTGA